MNKLKFKGTVLIYENDEFITIRYGHDAYKIENDIYEISKIMECIRKNFTVELIHEHLIELSNEFINDVINSFDEAFLLEFCDSTIELSDYDYDRWSRNYDFFGAKLKLGSNKYEYQKTIADSKITLLGCGGLGSHILYELAAVGFQNINILDFDKIELSNLNRQILYKEVDIGSEKVYTAKKRIEEFNQNIKINAFNKKINSVEDIRDIIFDSNLVICVADKPRHSMARWLNEACVIENIPFINGGLNLQTCSIYSVIPGKSGCAQCWLDCVSDNNKDGFDMINNDHVDMKDFNSPAPAFSPLVSILTGLFIQEAVRIITKLNDPLYIDSRTMYNYENGSLEVVEKWNSRNSCCVCGDFNEKH